MPMLDIHNRRRWRIDRLCRPGGAFRVRPQSAGAVPPAVWARAIGPPSRMQTWFWASRSRFPWWRHELDPAASHAVIAKLAAELELSFNETAEGVLTIINSNMANAIRSRTVQKGIDPRGFSLVAFGGAGPLHGVEVAAMLGIPEVIVPPYPGINSAMGLLTTDIKYDAIRTQFQVMGNVDVDRLNADCQAMESQLSAQFDADHIPASDVSFERVGDLRRGPGL